MAARLAAVEIVRISIEIGKGKDVRIDSGSDAGRLASIKQLETEIAAQKPFRTTSSSNLALAGSVVYERQAAISAIDAQLKQFNTVILHKIGCVYLNGSSLDRGALSLGRDQLRFAGWYGTVDVPLASIREIVLGASCLPTRAGIPLLERFWPGAERAAETLLLAIQDTDSTSPSMVVLVDISDATAWRSLILGQQERLGDVATQRSGFLAQRETAVTAFTEASRLREIALHDFNDRDGQIRGLQGQRDKLMAQQREFDAAQKRAAQADADALRRTGKR